MDCGIPAGKTKIDKTPALAPVNLIHPRDRIRSNPGFPNAAQCVARNQKFFLGRHNPDRYLRIPDAPRLFTLDLILPLIDRNPQIIQTSADPGPD
jgi:hypothetical protein